MPEEDFSILPNFGAMAKRLRAGTGVSISSPDHGVLEIASSSLEVVGPFDVDFEALDPVSYVWLTDLPDDCIVWRAFIQVTSLFDTVNERVHVYLGKNADEAERVRIADKVATADSRSTTEIISETPANGESFPFSWVAQAVGDDVALFAGDQVGSNSVGSARIYALVSGG